MSICIRVICDVPYDAGTNADRHTLNGMLHHMGELMQLDGFRMDFVF